MGSKGGHGQAVAEGPIRDIWQTKFQKRHIILLDVLSESRLYESLSVNNSARAHELFGVNCMPS
jgi:hypothetical protein